MGKIILLNKINIGLGWQRETGVRDIESYRCFIPLNIAKQVESDEQLRVYGIVMGDEPAGVMVVRTGFLVATLRYIFIKESLRGWGLASEAIDELLISLREENYVNLTAVLIPNLDKNIYSILNKYSPRVQLEEIGQLSFRVGDVKDKKRIKMSEDDVVAFSLCTSRQINSFVKKLRDNRIKYIPEEFVHGQYEGDISCVYFEQGQIAGILACKYDNNQVLVDYMSSIAKDKTSILKMMGYSIRQVCKRYGEDTIVNAVVVNEKLTTILEIVLDVELSRQVQMVIDLAVIDLYAEISADFI